MTRTVTRVSVLCMAIFLLNNAMGQKIAVRDSAAAWASAAKTEEEEINWTISGDELVVTSNTESPVVMQDYTQEFRPDWDSELKSVTSLSVSLISHIGNFAFYYGSKLEDINFDNNLESIGSYAFRYCRCVRSLSFPDSVKTIGDGSFSDCTLLGAIDFGSITSIGDLSFYGCRALESISLPDTTVSIGN